MDLPIETIAHRRFNDAYNYNQKINYYNRTSENENYINGFQWGDTVKAMPLQLLFSTLKSGLWTTKSLPFQAKRLKLFTDLKV